MSENPSPVQGQLFPLPESAPPESLEDLLIIGEGLGEQLHDLLERLRLSLARRPEFLADNRARREQTLSRVSAVRELAAGIHLYMGELVELVRVDNERATLRRRIADLRDAAQKDLINNDPTGAAEKTAQADSLSRQLQEGTCHA